MCRWDWTPSNAVRLAHIAYLHPHSEQLILQAEVCRYLDWYVDAHYSNDALDVPHKDPIWIFYIVSMVDL